MEVKFDFSELEQFGKNLKNQREVSKHFKAATRELTDALKTAIKANTPVKTGTLKAGWDTNGGRASYTVRRNKNGYSVTLYNRVPYAYYVNYGHYSYNQFNVGGAPYTVKNRTVPYYDGCSDDTFVFGHFFIEKAILQMENSSEIMETIISNNLEKWWGWCVNG